MIFRGLHEDNGWTILEYNTTWHYGYDFMLDAAQSIIDTDFQDGLQRVATAEVAGGNNVEQLEAVKACGNNLRECQTVQKECGSLTIAGTSQIMECPVQFVFYNQTNLVRLFSPVGLYFQQHGEHVFDNYMNSIEIKAYCADTERRVLSQVLGQGL